MFDNSGGNGGTGAATSTASTSGDGGTATSLLNCLCGAFSPTPYFDPAWANDPEIRNWANSNQKGPLANAFYGVGLPITTALDWVSVLFTPACVVQDQCLTGKYKDWGKEHGFNPDSDSAGVGAAAGSFIGPLGKGGAAGRVKPGEIASSLGNHVTTGQVVDGARKPIGAPVKSGETGSWKEIESFLASSPNIKNPPHGPHVAATHAEAKIAWAMRHRPEIKSADVVINNPKGVCGIPYGCSAAVPAILNKGQTMRVWYPGATEWKVLEGVG
jgi:hypothetical protein